MSSLVVNTNLTALNAYNNLNNTSNAEAKAIGELSSGLAIQTAADGPAAYVTAESLQSQSNGYSSAMSNAQNGVSLIQTASGALNQIASILQTMNSLALSSANGATNDSSSLAANQSEFTALQSQIDQIANTTSFGSTALLNGAFSGTTATATNSNVLQVGAFGATSNQLVLTIGAATTGALGVAAASVSLSNAASAQAAVTAVQSAISAVSTIEAGVGATQNQLQAIVANLTVGQQNLQSAYSSLVNVNFAQETTQFSTDQILMQSGVSMLSQANQAPQMMLKLLQ